MTNEILGDPPIAYHAYLTDASGGRLPLFRWTDEVCTMCAPRFNTAGVLERARIGVTFSSRDGRAETIQCTACDFSMTRPRRLPANKRMNDGQ